MADAGIDRDLVYMTNAVKHFKWKPSGKRRLHQKPSARETAACSPWLNAEIAVVKPRILVCLGATAAQSVLGRDFRVTKTRGTWVKSDLAEFVIATLHPSAVLRAPSETREAEYAGLVADLAKVAEKLDTLP